MGEYSQSLDAIRDRFPDASKPLFDSIVSNPIAKVWIAAWDGILAITPHATGKFDYSWIADDICAQALKKHNELWSASIRMIGLALQKIGKPASHEREFLLDAARRRGYGKRLTVTSSLGLVVDGKPAFGGRMVWISNGCSTSDEGAPGLYQKPIAATFEGGYGSPAQPGGWLVPPGTIKCQTFDGNRPWEVARGWACLSWKQEDIHGGDDSWPERADAEAQAKFTETVLRIYKETRLEPLRQGAIDIIGQLLTPPSVQAVKKKPPTVQPVRKAITMPASAPLGYQYPYNHYVYVWYWSVERQQWFQGEQPIGFTDHERAAQYWNERRTQLQYGGAPPTQLFGRISHVHLRLIQWDGTQWVDDPAYVVTFNVYQVTL